MSNSSWPSRILGFAIGLLIVLALWAAVSTIDEQNTNDVLVEFKNGTVECFEDKEVFTSDGFVRIGDSESVATFPESRVVRVVSSENACE